MTKRDGLLEAARICDERAIKHGHDDEAENEAELCAALIRARAAQEGDGWISVSERLPKENEDVLAVCTDRVFKLYLRKGTWWERGDLGAEWDVKFWMPLPAPPKC